MFLVERTTPAEGNPVGVFPGVMLVLFVAVVVAAFVTARLRGTGFDPDSGTEGMTLTGRWTASPAFFSTPRAAPNGGDAVMSLGTENLPRRGLTRYPRLPRCCLEDSRIAKLYREEWLTLENKYDSPPAYSPDIPNGHQKHGVQLCRTYKNCVARAIAV
jgi:hypothetical protein